MDQPIWITEADVVDLLSLADAIVALEAGMRAEAAGQAAGMPKTMLQFGTSNLHALGGQLGEYVGTKSWAHTEGGTCPLLLLWRAGDGQLAAVIEAFALGNMRTGGTSGLATDWMAKPDCEVLAIAGTGKQALSQVAAVLAVRPIRQVRVFSPNQASRAAFVGLVESELAVSAVDCATMAQACEGAQVVTLVTRARAPFLDASMLAHGAHVNAVGAIGPDREEFAQDLFERTGLVGVDSLSSVKTLSLEFRRRYGDGDWSKVPQLSSLIAAGRRRRPDVDLSLFKAMGTGLSDLALAVSVLERARSAGVGRMLPVPKKSKPRLAMASRA